MKKKVVNKNTGIIFFLILLAVPLILPYFHAGYFTTHDGEWAVVRLTDMYRSLKELQFPVRYSGFLNFGYGYPLFNFVYPAPYYLGVVIHFFKIGFVDTIKVLFAFSVIFSAITMYLAASTIWRNKVAGIISAFFYVYLPYRIVDLYARGSIGESVSFALFPLLLFLAAKMLEKTRSKKYLVLGVLAYAFLIMTHNIMALLFSPFLVLFIILKLYLAKWKGYITALLFLGLSYGVSAFFWLPALFEKHTIRLSEIPIADRDIYFVTLQQLVTPKWGYGLPDNPDGFTYQIGLAQIAIFLVSVILLITLGFLKKKLFKSFEVRLASGLTILIVILTLLMFSFTSVIWESLPLLREINYPWTLLSQIGLLLSLLAGFLWLQNKWIRYLLLLLCLSNLLLVLPHAKPQMYVNRGDDFYLTNDATTTSSNELMPLWAKKDPTNRSDTKVSIIKGDGIIENIISKSNKLTFSAHIKESSVIRINLIYYPGWEIMVDGKEVPITYKNEMGLMEITIPAGKHQVRAQLSETPLRLFSDIISLLSFVMIVALPFIGKKSKHV